MTKFTSERGERERSGFWGGGKIGCFFRKRKDLTDWNTRLKKRNGRMGVTGQKVKKVEKGSERVFLKYSGKGNTDQR